jgi:hypothetical protein
MLLAPLTQQYLREQGADSKPRGLNASASAVVRLAMPRLIKEVSPQQVNDLLADAVSAHDVLSYVATHGCPYLRS